MIGKEAASAPDLPWMHPLHLPEDISLLVSKALSAKDYFLIWGPPGSGKTSMVIHSLVENIILHTGENVLLLAYTNRAVDEICESIEKLKDEELYDFIRIGSRYGVAEKYHHKLLDHKLRKVENRRELRKMLKKHRIFTATIASMQGKKELFDLFAFDTVIIDEASQILEPNLIGLLNHFKKFILIGDHKQLPAVSSQRFQNTIIEHQGLKELGFISTSYSLFERLYKQCQTNGWHHSYGMLTHQGRMHADIMKLPSNLFYEGRLSLMSEEGRQTSSLKLEFQNHSNEIGRILSSHRCIFIPIESEGIGEFSKTNSTEVSAVGCIVKEIIGLYKLNNKSFSDETIGIMSPFRAHNAAITSMLQQLNEPETRFIKTDTVERYQGSARDIVIFSCCANSRAQLAQISQLDAEGVNRKLNVALTRAKEQIIVIGNPTVLAHAPEFRELMATYYHWEFLKTGVNELENSK